MICKHCNQIIDDNARFCSNCGAAQEPAAQNTETKDPVQGTAAGTENSAGQQSNPAEQSPSYYYEQQSEIGRAHV